MAECISHLLRRHTSTSASRCKQIWVPNGNLHNSPSGFTFSEQANFGEFTLLFCRGRLRNVPSFKTLLLSYYSTHYIFCFATSSLPGFAEGSFTNKLLFFLCFVISLSLSLTFLTFKNLSFLIQNACSKNQLCQNNAACQSGYTIKGYRCSCPPGFEGEYCEKGKF